MPRRLWIWVAESRVLRIETKLHGAGCTIPLLADDHFRVTLFVWIFFVVVVISVKHHDNVGILLDGT